MKLKKLAVPILVKKIDMIIAVVVGLVTFATLWLHDVVVFGDVTPSPLMVGAGIGTLLTTLVANMLPAKWAPWFLLALVMIISFFYYPAN